MNSPKPKRKRTRSGCALCRARKVKCDERQPACTNCERLQLSCPGAGPRPPVPADQGHDTSSLLTQAGIPRQRTYRSCLACRIAKTRCSGKTPCSRCSLRSITCVYGTEPAHAAQSEELLVVSPVSISQTVQNEPQGPLSWLLSPDLPRPALIRRLAEEFFANIHPIRCFGFIHKPSFMLRLDEGLAASHHEGLLLYIVCALGAKFYALEYSNTVQSLPSNLVLSAGNEWAKKSSALIFGNLNDISVEKLMACVLLYDHEVRVGNYASAFMLSAISARMSQGLQINLEYSADVLCAAQTGPSLSPSAREARRRLMWSCYVMDSWVGSGVDQLTLLEDNDIKIQLPCHSRNFLLQIPCITEILEEGKVLRFLPRELIPFNAKENMGMTAYFIRLVKLRKKVLRYVKHLDTEKPPWEPDSPFATLSSEFEHWKAVLPSNLNFNASSIYTCKESNQLGALTVLWCTYHQTLVDLNRIGLPRLFKIRKPIEFPNTYQGLRELCQTACFEHAQNVAITITEALKHGAKMLADTWMCIIAHDSTKVMLYYLTEMVDAGSEGGKRVVKETSLLVRKNLSALRAMRPLFATAEHCHRSAVQLAKRAGIDLQMSDEEEGSAEGIEGTSIPGTPVQETPEYVLNPLAIYRLARRTVPEKHAESTMSPVSAPDVASPTGDGFPQMDYSLYNPQTDFMQPISSELWDLPPFPMDLDGWQPADTVLEGGMWAFGMGEDADNSYIGMGN